LKVSDFDYELPERLIAQTPLEKRDESRLLVVHRKTKSIEHRVFKDIIEYLNPGDCLVINDTKVIPARLLGKRKDTGGKMEFVLLSRENDDTWRVLVKPLKAGSL
jgi:S-adenosylmethionine:tRNA ribosyltransferase-isomerase